MLLRRANTAILTGLVIVGALGSCSSDPGPSFVDSDLPDVIATFEGRSVQIDGSLTIDGSSANIEGQSSGSTLGGDAVGFLTGSVPFDPPVPLDLRFEASRVVSARTADAPSTPQFPALLVHGGGFGVGEVETPMAFLAGVVEPFFPPVFLERLSTTNPTETSTDGGVAVLTYDYAPSQFGDATTTLELRVRDDATLEHVEMRSETGDTTVTLEYDIVLTDDPTEVSLPEVTPPTVIEIGPSGDFVEVQQGSTPDITWRLLQAPSRAAISCWRVEASPAVVVDEPNSGGGARCIANPDPADELVDQVVFALTSDGSSDGAVLVALVPEGASDAKLGFFGGDIEPATIEDGRIVWAGANLDNPVYLEVTLGETAFGCGMGALSSRSELRDSQLADVRLGLPWTCAGL